MTSRTQLEGMIELYKIRKERLEGLMEALTSEEALTITAGLPVSPRDLIAKSKEAIKETQYRIDRYERELAAIVDVEVEVVEEDETEDVEITVTAPSTELVRMTPDFMPEEQIPDDVETIDDLPTTAPWLEETDPFQEDEDAS